MFEPTTAPSAVVVDMTVDESVERPISLGAVQGSEQVTPTVRAPRPTIRAPLSAVTRTVFSQSSSALTVTVGITASTPLTAAAPPPTPVPVVTTTATAT
ncbi:MAG TPA: hypothetical protein PKE45_19655, partial [Caldilineaceae bacterium]|nr:hypothetical protein [Caldilineaceae bacterium]